MKRLLATAAVLGIVAACSRDEIVVAAIPGEDGGTLTSGAPIRCTDTSDCPGDQMYCERRACGSAAGICVLPPTTCPNTEDPVCGCDGVTYFNDCLRRKNGASGSEPGECLTRFLVCDGAAIGCPSNAYCVRLVPYSPKPVCHDVDGRCWVIPDVCPPPTSGDRWSLCRGSDDPPSTELRCLSTCRAIQEGAVFVGARGCQ